jgi:RNA recognition motif-containing protein
MSIKKRKRELEEHHEEIEIDTSAPEPPSKRALRRVKKGKPLPPSKNTPPPTDTKADDDTAKKQGKTSKRSIHGVWIGNLPWTATKADIRKFLTENSDITEEMITRVHMPSQTQTESFAKATGTEKRSKANNKGFAYIDFANQESVHWAIDLSELLLAGRRILIKDSKNFEGRPEKLENAAGGAATRSSSRPPNKRVFVGNLGFDITEDDLRVHFSKCGELREIKVATFEDSGKCKGFAWVEFDDIDAAVSAVRGWVRIEENVDDDDGGDDGDDDDDDDEEEEEEEGKEEQTFGSARAINKVNKGGDVKFRKWWVNRIKGRPLRMEFGEDKNVRYKKRFGKSSTSSIQKSSLHASGLDDTGDVGDSHSSTTSAAAKQKLKLKHNSIGGKPEKFNGSRAFTKADARKIKPGAALAGAQRLTGAIVKSQGKKITFS